ncbi:O-antigen ligase family protein [Mesorhizobium sp. BR1-1-16]|uniref:O-antigen ligase family protein n=1 Tax=Mesorhizobium sp. BR1-1-16 TaxID=2876653 RepID=UPI001CC95265|nr:O-antigen ligase family protein [Mesorhizobium sp. BR1-1-16]MBZ9937948.1 O-antigen ligase family protein [Mesorhizobium sp. BR1-1-16]
MSDTALLASHSHDRGQTLYDRVLFLYACAVFATAVLLGGDTAVGAFSDQLIEIISVPLLVLSLSRLMHTRWQAGWGWVLLIPVLALAVPLLQLVPLPPSLWTGLPGRAAVVEVLQAAGLPIGWRPLSLAPFATLYSFLSLLPATALFVATIQLETSRRYALLVGALAVAGISGLLGIVQLLSRDVSDITMDGAGRAGFAIGFFANRNHYAALIYVMIPLAVMWTLREMRGSRGRRRVLGMVFGGGVVASLLVGLSSAYSRAGIALGVVSLLGSAFIAWRTAGPSRLGRWPVIIAGGALLVFAVVLQLGLIQLLIFRSVSDSARASIARLTMEAIEQYSFAGSGFGTFVPVFKAFEQPSDVIVFFINHAHNDYLELTLEGGVLAAIVIAIFLIWFGKRFWTIWLSRFYAASGDQRMLASAASLSVGLLLLHSLLDYPMRTLTLMSCFAVACAFMTTPPPEAEGSHRRRHGSSRGELSGSRERIPRG